MPQLDLIVLLLQAQQHQLNWLLGIAKVNQERLAIMSKELDVLTAQVKANTELEASAVTLIQGIAQQLADAKTDPAKVQQLADQLKASAEPLAAAIAANTQVSPPTP